MSSYGQYCPIARGAEIFADRWTPLIIRELLAGTHHFNDLERGLPGISRSLLAQRLRRLEHAGIIERRPAADGRRTEYHLTPAGLDLRQVVDSLGEWGAHRAFGNPKADELDPALLLWWMHRRINLDLLPPRRVVVGFDFRGAKRQRLWLLLEPRDVSVCFKNPGFETDLMVTADIAAFYKVWLGRISLESALREGLVEIDGPPALARAFPRWLQWSHLAGAVRAAATHTPSLSRPALR